MPEKATAPKKVSDKSTKQELLDAYQALAQQLEEKRAAELNPARHLEEKKAEEAVQVATSLSPDGIDRDIGGLRAEIGKSLAEIADKLQAEVGRFKSLQQAVAAKQRELQEMYGIEKAATSLAALIEAQNQKRREFETDLAGEKEELTREIEATREAWDQEKKAHEAETKERESSEKKARDREREEFSYLFKREQQAARDKLADEKATLEKALQQKKEAAEKELGERERAVAATERELAQLRERTAAFPKELETAVAKAVKETADRLQLEAKNREELLRKGFDGERNVLTARLEALERIVKDLTGQNTKLAQQQETAYQKVQEIAEKAVEGSSHAKSFAELQKLFAEQNRKAGEKA